MNTDCKSCHGVGSIPTRDPVLFRTNWVECGTCFGEGGYDDQFRQQEIDNRLEMEQEQYDCNRSMR